MNKTTRILVVDDEPEILRVFTLVLNAAGYDVLEAATGQEGLQLAREKHPDLVLLDVLLPDLSGMEVCKQIKADAELQNVFVVLISGGATNVAHKVEGLKSGADDYMVKPLDPDELLARIRTIVRLKDTMAAVRASEEHYRHLIEILPDAVCVIDSNGRLLAVNPRAVAILGYASAEELLQKSAFDIAPAAEHEQIRANIAAAFQTGSALNAEYTLLKKNGVPVQTETSAIVSLDSNGQPTGLVVVGHNITERKQAEQKIRQLLDLLDNTSDAIIIHDLEGHIRYFNRGAERLLGSTADEVRGRHITDLFFQDAAAYAAAQAKLRQDGKWNGEVQAVTKARKSIILSSHWTLVNEQDGEFSHVVTINTDITERKEAEEALRLSQERYRSLAESSPDAIFILDREFIIQYVNRVAMQWLNKPETEVLGHSQSKFFPPEIDRDHQEFIQKVFQTGETAHTERLDSFGGIAKWIETRLVPLGNQQGKVTHVMGISRDVTERKMAEAALRASEQRYRNLVETTSDWVWEVDENTVYTYASHHVRDLLGYEPAEVLGRTPFDLMLPDEAQRVARVFGQIAAQHQPFRSLENINRHKDGRLVVLETSGVPFFDGDGTFRGYRGIDRDITERKQGERALRASEERFRQLADNIREVFWMSDPAKNKIFYVSPAYEETWGRTCENLYANPRDWVEAIHPDDRERVLEAVLKKQVSGEYDEVYRIKRPDGAIRWIQDRGFPVRDSTGKVYRVVGIAEDITQRKEAGEALRIAEARYRSIFETATEGIFRTTLDGQILVANPALARMFGYQSPEEMISSVTDIGRQLYVLPEKRAEIKRLLQEQGTVQEIEAENYRKDGSKIWVSLNAHVVRDLSGAVQYLQGTIQDITQRKWAERLLQTQRDIGTFLSLTIDLNATAAQLLEFAFQYEGIDCGGVFLVEPETEVLELVAQRGFSNDFAERTSHFAADPMLERPAGTGRAGSRRFRGPLTSIVQKLKREGLSAMEIFPVQHKGDLVAVLSVGSHTLGEIPPKSYQALEVIAAQAAGAISRIQTERLLRANRQLLEKTLRSLPAAVFVVNAVTMTIEECNPATTQIFGYTRDELIGLKIGALHVNEAKVEQFGRHLNAAVKDEGFLSNFEFEMKRKDGTVFPTEHSMMPISDEVGRLVDWVSVIHDITERKRAEEELRQLPRRIIEAQETERLRVAREIHDGVNQIIASVKMRLRKVESQVGTLNPATRQILARCDQLLVQALEENRRIAYNLRPSDLDEFGLAVACRNFCKEIQARSNLTVQCKIQSLDRRLPPMVELDLFRIVQEALTNIEKHARAKTVRLRLSLSSDTIVLSIRDDGRGFPPQRPMAGKGKWRGIGLTNMRERALSLGGVCEVRSVPKKGTTVSVRVPCKPIG